MSGSRPSTGGRSPSPSVALLVLVWLGRDMTFYHDEWALILKRDLSVNGILAPHNEHLSATLVILYRVLIGTVGLGSYWPYLGRHVRPPPGRRRARLRDRPAARGGRAGWALGAMAVMLFLGLRRRRHPLGVPIRDDRSRCGWDRRRSSSPRADPGSRPALLTLAMATSGASLAFFVGTGVRLAAHPASRCSSGCSFRPACISPGTSRSALPA